MLPGCGGRRGQMEVSCCRPRYLIAGSGWRLGFCGQHRRELLCRRPRIRHIAMEIRSEEPDHVVPGGGRGAGLVRRLRWQFLRLGYGDRPIEMEVPDRLRARANICTGGSPGKSILTTSIRLDSSRRRTQHDMRYLNPVVNPIAATDATSD